MVRSYEKDIMDEEYTKKINKVIEKMNKKQKS